MNIQIDKRIYIYIYIYKQINKYLQIYCCYNPVGFRNCLGFRNRLELRNRHLRNSVIRHVTMAPSLQAIAALATCQAKALARAWPVSSPVYI